MNAPATSNTSDVSGYLPNEFDRKRIAHRLEARERYRYVQPSVVPIGGGYLIRSPCCSRNIDPHGGVIDIAMCLYAAGERSWQLFHMLHESQQWRFHSAHRKLDDLLEELNADPCRLFWR